MEGTTGLTELQKRFQEIAPRCDAEVIVFIMELLQRIEFLEEEVKGLKDKVSKDSSNSHQPPSTDGFKKKYSKSLRKQSGKKAGGQIGHSGSTLVMVTSPDEVIVHRVNRCKTCQKSLQDVSPMTLERRQIFDIPEIAIRVTEHQAEGKTCLRCGTVTAAKFPVEVKHSAAYGERIKALTVYMTQYQLLPYARTTEIFRDVFSHEISAGSLYNATEACYKKLETTEQRIKEEISGSAVVHFDETGIYGNKERNWLHVACTKEMTYYAVDDKRGRAAIKRIGILPEYRGTAVHDHWESYKEYGCRHAYCNAHHLRELKFAHEQEGAQWAEEISQCLMDIKRTVDTAKEKGKNALKPEALASFQARYEAIVKAALTLYPTTIRGQNKRRGRGKQSKSKNLLDRLIRYQTGTLAFMYDFNVPFDNNQAERDIRMTKVKQKISGCFRSKEGAKFLCRIRGYISTVKKHGANVLEAIVSAFKESPFLPPKLLSG